MGDGAFFGGYGVFEGADVCEVGIFFVLVGLCVSLCFRVRFVLFFHVALCSSPSYSFPPSLRALSTMLYANQQDLLLASTNGEPDNSLKYLARTISPFPINIYSLIL